MVVATLMIVVLATGCAAKKDTATDSTSKVATNSDPEILDEMAIKDTYTGIDDVYVQQGAEDVDYLDGVLYDSSIVQDIKVDSSKVDTSKEGTYKITYTVTVNRAALDEYRNTKTANGTKTTKKENADKDVTETVIVEKKVTIVNKDKAQELADKNKPVFAGKGETVKKTAGSEVTTEQKTPASTTVTNGTVINASNKGMVQRETKKATTEAATVTATGDNIFSGTVTDASTNYIQVTSADGTSLGFPLGDGVAKNLKNGLEIGITVDIGYNGTLSGTDTSNCTVVSITQR